MAGVGAAGGGGVGGAPGIAAAVNAIGSYGIPAASVGPQITDAPAPGPSAAWQQRGTWFDASQVMYAPGAHVNAEHVNFATEHDFRVALAAPSPDQIKRPRPLTAAVPGPAQQAPAPAPVSPTIASQVASLYAASRPV